MTFGSAARTIIAMIAVSVTVGLAGCATSAASTEPLVVAAADSDALRVAFYGDSYTRGTGASAEQLRWSTLLSSQHGWSEFNPSVSGLGFMRNRAELGDDDLPSLIIADDPDVVIVTMGLNDNFTFDEYADELPGQILSDFERLATELPDAQLIVVEPFWYKTQRPDSVDVIISWVSDAAAAVGADYISGASYWLTGHPEWMSEDNLHPNDAGHAAIASQMDLALRDLGL
ncbi:SGNH/GDSL hydrolase family protein [Salinibacterium sp. NK8237]|uniref:SGNH/GDSL hydrolase family protein n=1 Tax=Salinibacterium sp. NK8237 TaxID=2792038 RepID=UPI0018CE99A2|nr:SGNH/GDSL hydrolase family protein [Salinibacterium sp. NK8237]MBH0130974.1 SGNH/GDSL hydrolase family protein [Salinibacterium sp. NK8237]